MKVERHCKVCGKRFFVYPCRIRRYGGKGGTFCSRACFHKHSSKKVTLKCLVCEKEFKRKPSALKAPGAGRYCSLDCMFKAKTRKVLLICQFCGKKFYRALSQVRRGWNKYCSSECWYNTIVGRGNPNYSHGRRMTPHNFSNWKRIRKLVLFRDAYTCQICGSHSDLVVHHIIPCRISVINELNNLITHCRRCHRLIEGDKLNEGFTPKFTKSILAR